MSILPAQCPYFILLISQLLSVPDGCIWYWHNNKWKVNVSYGFIIKCFLNQKHCAHWSYYFAIYLIATFMPFEFKCFSMTKMKFHVLLSTCLNSSDILCKLLYVHLLLCFFSHHTLNQTSNIWELICDSSMTPFFFPFTCIGLPTFDFKGQWHCVEKDPCMTVWCKLTSIRNMWTVLFLAGKLQCSISFNTLRASCCRPRSLLNVMEQRWNRATKLALPWLITKTYMPPCCGVLLV